jgi:hypothetical protein
MIAPARAILPSSNSQTMSIAANNDAILTLAFTNLWLTATSGVNANRLAKTYEEAEQRQEINGEPANARRLRNESKLIMRAYALSARYEESSLDERQKSSERTRDQEIAPTGRPYDRAAEDQQRSDYESAVPEGAQADDQPEEDRALRIVRL